MKAQTGGHRITVTVLAYGHGNTVAITILSSILTFEKGFDVPAGGTVKTIHRYSHAGGSNAPGQLAISSLGLNDLKDPDK